MWGGFFLLVFLLIIVIIVLLLPPAVIMFILWSQSRKTPHSIIRSHPYLGWLRYFLEKIGPEFRQYWFDNDTSAEPFSRNDFLGITFAAKYRTDLISFGGKRDYDLPGYYLANSLFTRLAEEMSVDNRETIASKKYTIHKEGLFSRKENFIDDESTKWLLSDEDALVVGKERIQPWVLKGLFGVSATSYGAVGEHYILSTGQAVQMAGGSWMNTGEGGVAPEHLQTGADLVAQIGPGLFGYRDEKGDFSYEEFRKVAAHVQVKAFELKFAQGAKIRGGHLEGSKVSAKVAAIRKVPEGITVNSPNRFPFLNNAERTLKFVADLQKAGGKPVGIKIVVGAKESLIDFFVTMKRLAIYPDFLTVDGGEGGSGATFKSMADSMGLPLYAALIAATDAAVETGVRDRFAVFASGKLISPDKVAIALALGADATVSARGFMIANGCIMALQCHTGRCPAGVTTTDPKYQEALLVEEKKWRVANYLLHVRSSVFALSAACGLTSPRQLTRAHVVYKNEYGRTVRASELFPVQELRQHVIDDGINTMNPTA
jgi:glutamate synthase domain-containing protein 2